MKRKEVVTGTDFILLAVLAFLGLGIEVLYAFLIEPLIYGLPMQGWTVMQSVIHWTVTSITWGVITILLVITANKRLGFNIFEKRAPMKRWQWAAVILSILFSIFVSYVDWNGFKVILEFRYNGLLRFIFQYIYYIFETALFILIIVFGQKACELWFKKTDFPYGGIALACTWGAAHFLTKGEISTGLMTTASGLLFGCIYLWTNRDIKKTFHILLIMFIL